MGKKRKGGVTERCEGPEMPGESALTPVLS
jgi:hypothetical protein